MERLSLTLLAAVHCMQLIARSRPEVAGLLALAPAPCAQIHALTSPRQGKGERNLIKIQGGRRVGERDRGKKEKESICIHILHFTTRAVRGREWRAQAAGWWLQMERERRREAERAGERARAPRHPGPCWTPGAPGQPPRTPDRASWAPEARLARVGPQQGAVDVHHGIQQRFSAVLLRFPDLYLQEDPPSFILVAPVILDVSYCSAGSFGKRIGWINKSIFTIEKQFEAHLY
nr:uncharacterized protein LOC106025699 [Cavia porcellus]